MSEPTDHLHLQHAGSVPNLAHPVLEALARDDAMPADDLMWLAKHGRSFIGEPRPGWCNPGPARRCFENAAIVADLGFTDLVYGFALPWHRTAALAHAWVTLDKRRAADPTWSRAKDGAYWGFYPGRSSKVDRRFDAIVERWQRRFYAKNPIVRLLREGM